MAKDSFKLFPDEPILDYKNHSEHEDISEKEYGIRGAGLIKDMSVAVNIKHTYPGDLVIKLKGPDGTEVLLHDKKSGESTDNLVKTFTSTEIKGLKHFIRKTNKGKWSLSIKDIVGKDSGTFLDWELIWEVEYNHLKMYAGGEISVDNSTLYGMGTGAFSVMANVSPYNIFFPNELGNMEKKINGGVIFSSKSKVDGIYKGGWLLSIEKHDLGPYMICFTISNGKDVHVLRAPIKNLFQIYLKQLESADTTAKFLKVLGEALKAESNSASAYSQLSHFVAAVKDDKGVMSLYIDGYLVAQATPYVTTETNITKDRFQLKGLFKESIDKPNHYYTVKRNSNNYKTGASDWDSSLFHEIDSYDNQTNNVKAITSKVKSHHNQGLNDVMYELQTGIKANLPYGSADTMGLYVRPAGKKTGQYLLAEFSANSNATDIKYNTLGLRIAGDELMGNTYPGCLSHVSIWKTALKQEDIISYMDGNKSEADSPHCLGFWKLEENLKDSSSHKNDAKSATESSDFNFVYRDKVLPVFVEEQKKENWCWAAIDLAIIEYYNPMSRLTQAEVFQTVKQIIANIPSQALSYLKEHTYHFKQEYNRSDVLTIPATTTDIATRFIYQRNPEKEITKGFLQKEFNSGNPVIVMIQWRDVAARAFLPTGHVVVLSGFVHTEAGELLIVNDPTAGMTWISLEDLFNGKYRGNGYCVQAFTTTAYNNIIRKDDPISIENGRYKLLKKDGSLGIYFGDALLANTRSLEVNRLEFSTQGDLTVNTPNAAEKQIVFTNPASDYVPKPPYSLAVSVTNGPAVVAVVAVKDNTDTLLYHINSLFHKA